MVSVSCLGGKRQFVEQPQHAGVAVSIQSQEVSAMLGNSAVHGRTEADSCQASKQHTTQGQHALRKPCFLQSQSSAAAVTKQCYGSLGRDIDGRPLP